MSERVLALSTIHSDGTSDDGNAQERISHHARKFHVPRDALEYLLNHGVEWQQWIHKKTDRLMLEFCPDGARALDPLLSRIATSCPIRMTAGAATATATRTTSPAGSSPETADGARRMAETTTTLLLLDEDLGKFEMITCPTNKSGGLDGCNIDCQFVL